MVSKTTACVCFGLCLIFSTQYAAARSLTQQASFLTYVNGQDPKGKPVTIAPLTVWTWCGFNSMEKLSASVNATSEVGLYIAPRRTVKTAEVSSLGLPGSKTCRGTSCSKSAPGRLVKYSRCVAVGNFDSSKSVNATIKVSSSTDSVVAGIISAITIAGIILLICLFVAIFCCCKDILCCCCCCCDCDD